MTATLAPRRPKGSSGGRATSGNGVRNIVEEIVARRRVDIEAAFLNGGPTGEAIADAPPPRGFVDRFLAPGLHLIAEIKRASPSAGRIVATRR